MEPHGELQSHPLADQAQACGRLTQVDGPEGPMAPVVTTGSYKKKTLTALLELCVSSLRRVMLFFSVSLKFSFRPRRRGLKTWQHFSVVLVILAQAPCLSLLCRSTLLGRADEGSNVAPRTKAIGDTSGATASLIRRHPTTRPSLGLGFGRRHLLPILLHETKRTPATAPAHHGARAQTYDDCVVPIDGRATLSPHLCQEPRSFALERSSRGRAVLPHSLLQAKPLLPVLPRGGVWPGRGRTRCASTSPFALDLLVPPAALARSSPFSQ